MGYIIRLVSRFGPMRSCGILPGPLDGHMYAVGGVFWDFIGYTLERPKYISVETEYGEINIHYIDEGSENTNTVLLLHGEPTWGYLYRNFIDPLVEKGLRVVVPDLPGFGKSDKLSKRGGYTYEKFVKWMNVWLNEIDLNNITFFGQDWGGLIGLRLVVNNQDRFDNIVLSNTGLPTGDRPLGEAFESWKNYSQTVENFHIG